MTDEQLANACTEWLADDRTPWDDRRSIVLRAFIAGYRLAEQHWQKAWNDTVGVALSSGDGSYHP